MTRATGMRWYVILGVVVAVAFTGFLWIVLGPGPMDFMRGQRVRIADFGGSDTTGVPAELASLGAGATPGLARKQPLIFSSDQCSMKSQQRRGPDGDGEFQYALRRHEHCAQARSFGAFFRDRFHQDEPIPHTANDDGAGRKLQDYEPVANCVRIFNSPWSGIWSSRSSFIACFRILRKTMK
jgi:hypothetical protein